MSGASLSALVRFAVAGLLLCAGLAVPSRALASQSDPWTLTTADSAAQLDDSGIANVDTGPPSLIGTAIDVRGLIATAACGHRPDFPRPPPDSAVSYSYDTPMTSSDPAADGGRVGRASSGLEVLRVAPRTTTDFLSSAADEVIDTSRAGVTRIGSDGRSIRVGERAPVRPGEHNVVVHGTPDGLQSVSTSQLNRIVNSNVPTGCTIRLLSCHAGANGVGQSLANATGRNVWAPTTRVGTPRYGPPYPLVVESPGSWVLFRPGGGR